MLIPKKVLSALSRVSYEGNDHRNLSGVYVEREVSGKPRATSLSLNTIVTVTWNEGDYSYPMNERTPGTPDNFHGKNHGGGLLLPGSAASSLGKASKCNVLSDQRVVALCEEVRDGCTSAVEGGPVATVSHIRVLDEAFPSYRFVTERQAKPRNSITVGSDELMKVLRAIQDLAGKDCKVTLEGYGKKYPIKLRAQGRGVEVEAFVDPGNV